MAIRTKKRLLAAPFVVTLAAACNTGDAPPKTPEVDVTPTASPTTAGTGTTTATTDPEERDEGESWTIREDGSGKCLAAVEDHCPEGASCNPPEPSVYKCPPDMEFPGTVTRKAGTKTCVAHIFSSGGHCPPGARCNPPPPYDEEVPCPK